MCEVTLKINLHSSESQDTNKWENIAHGYQRQNSTEAERKDKRTSRDSGNLTRQTALEKHQMKSENLRRAMLSYVMIF